MTDLNIGVTPEIIKKTFEKQGASGKPSGCVIPPPQDMSENNSSDESPIKEQQPNSVLKLTPPMVMSSIDSTGKSTMVNKMMNADISTNLSKGVTTGAYMTGMNSFRASQQTMEGSLSYMPMSMGTANSYATAEIIPDLRLYMQEGITYTTDLKGLNTQQNNSQLGVSLSKTKGPASINATAFKGKSIEFKDLAPIEGWSVEGKIDAGAVSATGKVLETKKAATKTRIYQGTLEIDRPSVTISANGSVGDVQSPEKTSRTYQGGVSLRLKPVSDKSIQRSVSQEILVDRHLSEAQKMQAIERIGKQETEDYEVRHAEPDSTNADYDPIQEAKALAEKRNEAESYGIKVKKTDTIETLQLAIDTKIVDKRLARRNQGTEKTVNLFVIADRDNLRNKSNTASLAYMEGNASVGMDVSLRSSYDATTEITSKSAEVRFNARYVW